MTYSSARSERQAAQLVAPREFDRPARGEFHDHLRDWVVTEPVEVGELEKSGSFMSANPRAGRHLLRGRLEATPGIEPGYTALQAVA